jgi:hypothetical protein
LGVLIHEEVQFAEAGVRVIIIWIWLKWGIQESEVAVEEAKGGERFRGVGTQEQ